MKAQLARRLGQRQMGHVAPANGHAGGMPQASGKGSEVLTVCRVDPSHIAQTPLAGRLGHGLLSGPHRIETACAAPGPSAFGGTEVQMEVSSDQTPQRLDIDADRTLR